MIKVPPVTGKRRLSVAAILRRKGFKVRFKGMTIGRVKVQLPHGNKVPGRGNVVTRAIGQQVKATVEPGKKTNSRILR